MLSATKCRAAVPLIACVAAGCRVGPDHVPPAFDAQTAAVWREPPGEVLRHERAALAGWWRSFGNPELDALAARLTAQNLSLAEARQRIVTARAARGIAAADRLPQVAAEVGYARAGTGDRSLNFQGPPPGQDVDVYSAGVIAGWELDLWGRVARLVEAADATIDVAVEDYRAAAVSLLAELALGYVDAHTLRRRIEVAERAAALQAETVRLATSRVDAGTGSRVDVEQAQRELDTTRARIPELRLALRNAENRIAVLVGERPRDGLCTADGPLTLPAEVGVGLPADLLTRRADVRAGERRLAAAVARIGAAEAERYPRLTLAGTLALRAQDFETLGAGADALSYSFGPELTVPLFTGGRIDSTVAARESESAAARLALERTLLEAIAEVESASHGVVRSREAAARLADAAAAGRRAVALAQELYDAGARSLLQVVDAQRALATAEDHALVGQQAALAQTVSLYRALGGGWEAVALDGSLVSTGGGDTGGEETDDADAANGDAADGDLP